MLFVAACLAAVSWAIVVSFNEETTTDSFLNGTLPGHDAIVYQVIILSVDELARRAQASVQLILNRSALISSPNAKGPIDGKFLLNNLDVRVSPLTTKDLGPFFDRVGTLALTLMREALPPAEPGPDYSKELPQATKDEVVVLGQPKFYPFDRYLIVGYISSDVLASVDKKDFFRVDEFHTEVYLRAPNLVMRDASDEELQTWPTITNANGMWQSTKEGREFQQGLLRDIVPKRKRFFAVVLQRPFFLRFFAVFLLVITLVSVAYYAVVSEVNAFALQALGYFVGLWAIRQMLVTGAPMVFTAVDYVILFLYAGLSATLIAKKLWA